ncbi:MAG: LacI family DNA-binding transcriptional regulator [Spartobacteria bacterium]
MRNVAELAGVSPATASMALRGLARVPAATRAVVERAAAELGYVRDPEIGQVLARSRRKAAAARETIVFLSEVPIGTKPDPRAPWLFHMRREATAAAHLLGCEVETVVIPADPSAMREVGRRLWLRGIRGILVGPVTLAAEARIEMDWEKFSAIELGTTLRYPNFHRVERLFVEDCRELFKLLRSKGRRRIGLALDARRRFMMRDIPEATLLLHLKRDPTAEHVAPLPPDAWNRAGFLAWLKKEKPDCIVVYEVDPIRWLKSDPASLRTGVGMAYLSASKPEQTGLVADVATMIRESVGMLHWMIQTGERGIPVRCRSHGFRNLLQKGKTG